MIYEFQRGILFSRKAQAVFVLSRLAVKRQQHCFMLLCKREKRRVTFKNNGMSAEDSSLRPLCTTQTNAPVGEKENPQVLGETRQTGI